MFEIDFLLIFHSKTQFRMAYISFQCHTKLFNLDAITYRNNKDDDKNWPYRMLIIGPSGSGKTNALLHLIQKQNNNNPIDKIFLYAKDFSEPKYQFLIEKRENAGIKNYNDPSAFIEYSNTMDDVYSNIDDYNTKSLFFCVWLFIKKKNVPKTSITISLTKTTDFMNY